MANKERNKRSARQARQRERAEREALAAASTTSTGKKTAAKASKTPVKVSSSNKKTGLLGRARTYLSDVRAEMHRVTWPSKSELTNYSVAVVAMLIVFGICVWLVDTGVVAALVGFTGLRG